MRTLDFCNLLWICQSFKLRVYKIHLTMKKKSRLTIRPKDLKGLLHKVLFNLRLANLTELLIRC